MRLVGLVETADGVESYPRGSRDRLFVIYGQDAEGLRLGERPWVAQWCATEQGARDLLPLWERHGGEWTILPVRYEPGQG